MNRQTRLPSGGASGQSARITGFGSNRQVAIITNDAKRDIHAIGNALSLGAFKYAKLSNPVIFDTIYRGKPGDGSMFVGITWIGDMLLEVIQPIADDNIYAKFLARRDGKPGVQHIFLENGDFDYDSAIDQLANAGVPPQQNGRMNAKGQIGPITLPPMPQALANRYASRFCYTESHNELGTDIELSHFSFGMPYRTGLRLAAGDEWIPSSKPYHFETVPDESIFSEIDTVYVLTNDIDAKAEYFAKLTDFAPVVLDYNDDAFPGEGRYSEIVAGKTRLVLIEPVSGSRLDTILKASGEGVQLIGGEPNGSRIEERLKARGWATEVSSVGLLAEHANVPFAVWFGSGAYD